MSKKWIVWRVVATLLLVGLLIAGGVAAYRAGWSQGYGAGQATVGGEEGATLPYPSPGWGRIGRPLAFMPFLFGAGLLFKLALGLVFLVVVGKLIRFIVWGAAFHPVMCGPGPVHGPRAARWYRRRHVHGPMPPWCWDWEEPSEAEADTDQAEA